MKRHLLVTLVLCGTVLKTLAAVPPPDKLLPADTLGLLTLPDYVKASAAWGQWPARQLWSDPALQPFKDHFLKKLKEDVAGPLEREFGIKFSDYAGLARGQITLALTAETAEDKAGQSFGFLLLLDARDRSENLRTALAELRKKWVESGKQIRTERIRDREFTVLIFSSDDLAKTLEKAFPDPDAGFETLKPPRPKKEARQVEWWIGQSDSLLLAGNSARAIEKVLVRQAGGTLPSLSEQATFAAQYGPLFREALGYGWLNLQPLLETALKSSPPAEAPAPGRPATPGAEKMIESLGLRGLQSVAFNLEDTGRGGLINVRFQVPEAQRKGLFRILAHEAKDASPLPFVPADAVKFMRWRLDLQKAWATVEAMLAEISPQYAGLIRTMVDLAGKDKDPNFDLRKQLIGNLGDDLVSYEKLPRKAVLEELGSPPSLFLISSARPDQLAAAIRAISSLLPQQSAKIKEREFLGRKVYTMPTPAAGPAKRPDRALHFSASGGYVALSYDVAMLEEYLRGNTAKALRDTPGLADAAEKVGGMSTGLFGFENQAETTRFTLEALKKDTAAIAALIGASPVAGRLGIAEDSKKIKEWADFSLLPPFDRIAKYFHLTVWSGNVNAEGLTIKVFTPFSPQFGR